MTWHDIDKDNLTTEGFDDFTADNLFARVIASLDQHRRLDAADQLLGRILFKHGNQVDRLECRKHLGACLNGLDRPARPFQARNRCIPVQAHDQTIARGARTGEKLDVTGMKQIEAPVGKSDA